jgi:hypothetical protein
MNRRQAIIYSLAAWLTVGAFWLIATRSFHPTWTLAVITTSALVGAFASAAYLNHLVLIPRYFELGQDWTYVLMLLAMMLGLTGLALLVIRISYLRVVGPDSDPLGVHKHFGIDLFGMAVHLALAAAVVCAVQKAERRSRTT